MKKKFNKISIRFNTQSDGINQAWRLILDETEFLTNKITVKGTTETSRDWMGDHTKWKHHITIKEAFVDFDPVHTVIYTKENTVAFDILKTISYRLIGSLITFLIALIATQNVSASTSLGLADLLFKPIIYFLHERLWRAIKKAKK